jgi:uncharacterized protein (TIGR02217 family)
MSTDNSFHEVRFPPAIAYGAVGGPYFNTGIVTTNSGFEQRSEFWAEAKIKFDVSQSIKTKKDFEMLLSFFRARKGKAYGFRFKDWSDYQAINQQCALLPYNSEEDKYSYQLQKIYTDSAGYQDIRTIKKPVQGTLHVFVDGNEQQSGFTCDYTTGIIKFDSDKSLNKVTATFEFDVPMRFDSDSMPVTLKNFNVFVWDEINIVQC